MRGTITIELTTSTPDSGSGLPDLGHTAYWLKKQLSELPYKDSNANEKPLSDDYEITRIETSAE